MLTPIAPNTSSLVPLPETQTLNPNPNSPSPIPPKPHSLIPSLAFPFSPEPSTLNPEVRVEGFDLDPMPGMVLLSGNNCLDFKSYAFKSFTCLLSSLLNVLLEPKVQNASTFSPTSYMFLCMLKLPRIRISKPLFR